MIYSESNVCILRLINPETNKHLFFAACGFFFYLFRPLSHLMGYCTTQMSDRQIEVFMVFGGICKVSSVFY